MAIMRWIALIVTVLVLAYLGQILIRAPWLLPAVIVGAVLLGYLVGEPHERREFKDAGRRVIAWLRSWGPGSPP